MQNLTDTDKNANRHTSLPFSNHSRDIGLSTVEESYQRVIIDLKESINILEELESAGIGRPNGTKDQIDQWTAKGILAYVYLTKGEYGG